MLLGLKRIYSIDGGVLEAQFLVRVDVFKCGMHHDGCFVKATQNQFQLSRIGVDISYGIDALYTSGLIFRVYLNRIFINAQPPVGYGA